MTLQTCVGKNERVPADRPPRRRRRLDGTTTPNHGTGAHGRFLLASPGMSEPAVPPLPSHAHAVANGHANGNGIAASALRRAILLHLRRVGPSVPDAISAAIGASRSGVAQQLRALDTAGLVTRTSVRHGVGRPRHLYDITPDAQGLFPSNYDGLATGLLAAILEVGGETLVEDVFAARRRQAEARLRQRMDASLPADAPLEDRVRELARLQDELGYVSEARVETTASACWSTTALSWTWLAACPWRAEPSSSCSARSSAWTWSASGTSPPATAAASTGSRSAPTGPSRRGRLSPPRAPRPCGGRARGRGWPRRTRWARRRPRARWPRSAPARRATGSRGGPAWRARRGCRS